MSSDTGEGTGTPSNPSSTDPPEKKKDKYKDYRSRNLSWFEKGKLFRMINDEKDSSDSEFVVFDNKPEHSLVLLITQHEEREEMGNHFQCRHLLLQGWKDFDERRAARKASPCAVLFLRHTSKKVEVPKNTWVDLDHETIVQTGARCMETALLDGDSLKVLRKNYLLAKAEEWGITQDDLAEDR